MRSMRLALALLLLPAGAALAADVPPQESTPTPRVRPTPTAMQPEAGTVSVQITERLAEYEALVTELGARQLEASLEERRQIQRTLQEANFDLRLDLIAIQLESARAKGADALVAKLEADRDHLIEVAKNPKATLAAGKIARPTDASPQPATPVEPSASTRGSLSEKGGNDR